MHFLLERDALNGKRGRAIATIDGENKELFQLKKLQTEAEFTEADFKVVGTTLVQKKTTGVNYTGTMTIYYGTAIFIRMVQEYQKTGKVTFFDIQVENDDPATSVGKQTVNFTNCKLSKIPLSMLDADADFLEEEVSFSFTGVEVLDWFTDPAQLG